MRIITLLLTEGGGDTSLQASNHEDHYSIIHSQKEAEKSFSRSRLYELWEGGSEQVSVNYGI